MKTNQIVVAPKAQIIVDGSPLATDIIARLIGLRVQQNLSLPTLGELTFSNPDGVLALASSPLKLGATLDLRVQDKTPALFMGEITAIEHVFEPGTGRLMRVRAYDVLHRLRKRQPVRTHVQFKLPELADQLVSDMGLSVEAVESGPLWHRVIQHSQCDLDLLLDLAGRCGLYLTLRDHTLHILTLEGIGNAQTLRLGESLLEASIQWNADSSCQSISAVGWNPWRVEPHRGHADRPHVSRDTTTQVVTDRLGTAQTRTLVNKPVQEDSQIDAWAQAEQRTRVASEVTLRGLAEGDPGLRPGTPVEVESDDSNIAGRYVLTAVTHTIDSMKGYVSEISTAPSVAPPSQRLTGGAAMTLGRVIGTDDPDRIARVQVVFEAYDEMESDWLTVLQLGAGPSKGVVVLPEIDDQVLVLMADGDPAQAVVLGGFYGGRVAPPKAADTDRKTTRPFTFLTPGGQTICLDDQQELVRMTNSDGSHFELTPEKVTLHSKRDLDIKAPGCTVTISGAKIDFKRA